MRFGDFSAHVVIEGEDVKEYEITVNSSGTQATCWIASEVGKMFSVKWSCHSSKRPACQGVLTVDGIGCVRTCLLPMYNKDTAFCSVMHLGTKERDLMFCNLQLSDDEALLGKPVLSHLGKIKLGISQGTIRWEPSKAPESGSQLTSYRSIYHEKSVKKLSTHCVGFGPEREHSIPSRVWEFVPNQDPPFEFIFEYRPIGILQANGIAPRSAPAIPTTLSDSSSGMQKTQSGVLERIALLENELKRLRGQAHDETEDRKPKRIKKEHTEKRPLVHGEVIDLT